MNYPLVSIIVVSYNHSGYIKENLDSVKNQTYPNIQLIVADDASPDNSAEVFEQWLKDNNYPAEKIFTVKIPDLPRPLMSVLSWLRVSILKLSRQMMYCILNIQKSVFPDLKHWEKATEWFLPIPIP